MGWALQSGEGVLQAQGDPQYRSLTRDRKERAATKTRVMQLIDDPRALNYRALPQVTAHKRVRPAAATALHHMGPAIPARRA